MGFRRRVKRTSALFQNDDRVRSAGDGAARYDPTGEHLPVGWSQFSTLLDLRAAGRSRGAVLAIVEIQDIEAVGGAFAAAAGGEAERIVANINLSLGGLLIKGDAYCWHAGRLVICLDRNALTVRKDLRAIADAIAKVDSGVDGLRHLTPAIGYVSLAVGHHASELVGKAEWALSCAKTSLEIEPFRYARAADPASARRRIVRPAALWKRVPPVLGLVVQLVMSLVLGFGAPFILYAICDALGSDISGAVYIGVVVVLVITATTIWIEGFLALRATEPPAAPGAPAPVASVIIAAYLPNEAATIIETVRAFLALDYANTVQVIIAYNSPFDRMPVEDELEAIAALHSGDDRFDVQPIRIVGSTSKAQNVNAAVGRVRGEFVGIFDADHHPQPDSIERAWRWLSNGWDIVQGRCSIRNGHESWVARMVAVEFEQIYAVSHPGRARMHGFGIFGGSNGFWRTAVLHETRMRHAMLTEDIDSSIRAVERGYRIAGDRDLISEELAPTTLPQLLNQRLRWAQGWFQVSLRRIMPALLSRRVSVRQKLGLAHLLVWRELFPWYSIQVVPIMTYWVWIYGWEHIHWTIPIFVATTAFTVSTGPAMVLFAYLLARRSMRQRPRWFIEYLLVSTFFYAPFKDTLSRIAHLKEAMRERAWRVTPRRHTPSLLAQRLVATSATLPLILVGLGAPTRGSAQPIRFPVAGSFASAQISVLLGGVDDQRGTQGREGRPERRGRGPVRQGDPGGAEPAFRTAARICRRAVLFATERCCRCPVSRDAHVARHEAGGCAVGPATVRDGVGGERPIARGIGRLRAPTGASARRYRERAPPRPVVAIASPTRRSGGGTGPCPRWTLGERCPWVARRRVAGRCGSGGGRGGA